MYNGKKRLKNRALRVDNSTCKKTTHNHTDGVKPRPYCLSEIRAYYSKCYFRSDTEQLVCNLRGKRDALLKDELYVSKSSTRAGKGSNGQGTFANI